MDTALTTADWEPVSAALAAAFVDDPVFGWLVPGVARRPAALRRYFTIEARDVALAHGVERRHLRRPHYYFGYIGVAPDSQGRGLGTTMLTPALDRCDAEGMPAYLEASSPSSAKLYARLGFEALEDIRPLGAPPIRLMVSEPR